MEERRKWKENMILTGKVFGDFIFLKNLKNVYVHLEILNPNRLAANNVWEISLFSFK